ncbi:DNA repair protein RAD51 homolog 4 isoform X1 [Ceratitis capitata]|nr:DNA repair protein RAD51 homolog 4 isoform X1 [Ceratitis capitata]XP_020713429.1 DNA repair protein RAD51 homolog 4 isoform X1 [Ceratitis capitata]
MTDLRQFDGLGLSTYLMRKLQRKGILTRYELLMTSNEELINLTSLPEATILEIKQKLGEDYFPRQQSLVANQLTHRKLYTTGIENLDSLLARTPLKAGSVWEICGKSGAGKTQLCHTIAVNFVSQSHGTLLYIDTKCDFSGTRIMEILRCRNVPNDECGHLMQNILVERIDKAEDICPILEKVAAQPKAGNVSDGINIKMIIIDALPAVFFTLRTETDRLKGKFLLTQLNNLIYMLAKEHQIAIIYVNLLVNIEEEQQLAEDVDIPDCTELYKARAISPNPTCGANMRPALGEYWYRAPHLRLSMEQHVDFTSMSGERTVKILRSCYSAAGGNCNIHITPAGVY